MLIKVFMLRTCKLELISFVRLDCRKGLTCKISSICIQRLKPASYPLSRGIIKDVKRTLAQFLFIFNEYEIQHFGEELKSEKLQRKKKRQKQKLATKDRY